MKKENYPAIWAERKLKKEEEFEKIFLFEIDQSKLDPFDFSRIVNQSRVTPPLISS